MKTIKFLLLFSTIVGLVACGGGGLASGPVASTEVFQLRTAYTNSLKASQSSFSVNGTASKNGKVVALTGSGTVTYSDLTSGFYGGNPALLQTTTVTGSAQGNGITFPVASKSTSYFNSNYEMLGNSTDAGYSERVTNSPSLPPLTAKVGDSGALWTFNTYSDSTKSSLIGKTVYSYVIEPDTASTALLKVIFDVYDNASKKLGNGSIVFKITPVGGISRVSETDLVTSADGIDLVLNFVY